MQPNNNDTNKPDITWRTLPNFANAIYDCTDANLSKKERRTITRFLIRAMKINEHTKMCYCLQHEYSYCQLNLLSTTLGIGWDKIKHIKDAFQEDKEYLLYKKLEAKYKFNKN